MCRRQLLVTTGARRLARFTHNIIGVKTTRSLFCDPGAGRFMFSGGSDRGEMRLEAENVRPISSLYDPYWHYALHAVK